VVKGADLYNFFYYYFFSFYFYYANLAYLYNFTIRINLINLITLITLVTLEALLVLANCPALLTLPDVPCPVMISQSHPMSGIIERVEMTSNQKKKLRK
jgi:hypothetical protein